MTGFAEGGIVGSGGEYEPAGCISCGFIIPAHLARLSVADLLNRLNSPLVDEED